MRTTFAESRSAQLVEGLRIIVQHKKLPRLLGGLSWTQGEPVKSGVRFEPRRSTPVGPLEPGHA